MGNFDDAEIIAAYPLEQALEDGVLVEIYKFRNGKKRVVATSHLLSKFTKEELKKVWDEFVQWDIYTKPALKEEDQLFATVYNGEKIWIIEDDVAFTLMYPEDY